VRSKRCSATVGQSSVNDSWCRAHARSLAHGHTTLVVWLVGFVGRWARPGVNDIDNTVHVG
jgi:hypothetical protein